MNVDPLEPPVPPRSLRSAVQTAAPTFAAALAWTLGAMLAGALALSCADGAEPSDDPDAGIDAGPVDEFEFEIGVWYPESDRFEPAVDEDTLDIVIGFQGLVFVELALLAPSRIPDVLAADVQVRFPNRPDYDYGFWQNQVEFRRDMSGVVSPEFRIPFGQDVALINGQFVEVEVELHGAGWLGRGSASFRIEDIDGCVMNPDGETVCDAEEQ